MKTNEKEREKEKERERKRERASERASERERKRELKKILERKLKKILEEKSRALITRNVEQGASGCTGLMRKTRNGVGLILHWLSSNFCQQSGQYRGPQRNSVLLV